MAESATIIFHPSARGVEKRITAASTSRRRRSKAKLILDPASGELHHPGGIVLLSRQRTALLTLLIRAAGELVPHAEVEALSRGYGEYTEASGRRRALIHNLIMQIRPLGLEIESRGGFGYRLHGDVQFRAMPDVAQ